jgi:hypothetical protein
VVTTRTARGGDAELNFMASPLLGSGIAVPRLPQLLMHAMQQHPKADATAIGSAVWALLRASGQGLVKDGKPIEGDEASVREITERLAEWRKSQQPIMKRLELMP